MSDEILPGAAFPLGATLTSAGVNFSVFSKNCDAVELLLFDRCDDSRPSRVIPLTPDRHRTFYYWHAMVPDLLAGQLYGYRVHGRRDPQQGFYFDASKVLLDPYAAVVMYGDNYSRAAACGRKDNTAQSLKGVVFDPTGYDWEEDRPPKHSFAKTILYELHVRGFTRCPSSGLPASERGTYAGLIEKIPYLKQLGITAVELLPVQQFDEQHPIEGQVDYWGYNPLAFFAPHRGYSARRDPLGPADEFRDLVKAMHRAGLEVILDVVFNHTAEGGEDGPVISLRGFENRAYYIPENGRAGHANFSGCGNTVNGNQSIVRRLIMDCLRWWVEVMHVDGFRFDLASVLARGECGSPLASPPILWEIESDPVLAGTKIIAEAWDAAGLYQVGSFVGDRWAEWNGQFRDDVRRFVKSDRDTVQRLATRLTGSPDLYQHPDREPHRSVHFVTCHDGFTLNDQVSYNDKHNWDNGEGNRDGCTANFSWNCGFEGPTDDQAIVALRKRQMRNLLTILLLSHGTPMILSGDEIARSQSGNNNAYCQDTALSWFNWRLGDDHSDLLRFVRELIRFRREHPAFRSLRYWNDASQNEMTMEAAVPRVTWHGTVVGQPDWRPESHSLACTISLAGAPTIYLAMNAYWQALDFQLPGLDEGCQWRRVLDTALTAPEDILPSRSRPQVADQHYVVREYSCLVLVGGSDNVSTVARSRVADHRGANESD